MADEEATYSTRSIVARSFVELVRLRPAMYVGDICGGRGQHKLIEHLLERVMSDHLEGYRAQADLKLEGSHGWLSTTGRPLVPGAGGFEADFTHMRTMHFVALPVLNALCRHLQVDVRHAGGLYRQHFARGCTLGPATRIADAVGTGLRLEFVLDDAIFDLQPWNLQQLYGYGEELCGLTPGLELAVQGRVLTARDGISSLLAARLESPAITPPIVCAGLYGEIDVEVALTWVDNGADATQPRIHGFANRSRTGGGTHNLGVLKGIGQAFANLDPSMGDANPLAVAELLYPGMVAIVHVVLEDPKWDYHAGLRNPDQDPWQFGLGGDEVSDAVACVVQRDLTNAWHARPEEFEAVRVACLGRLAGR